MYVTKKKKSGKYKCVATDENSKVKKSFVGDTQAEAEYLASEWLRKQAEMLFFRKPFSECIDFYIGMKANILSPTTIDRYKAIKRKQLSDDFLSLRLYDINQITVQEEINRLAAIYSPKTVKNAHGLISAVLKQYNPNLLLNTTLPQRQKIYKKFPSPKEIMDAFKDSEMELIVLLGLWLGLRMSEIRGLRKCDCKNGIITINQVKVYADGQTIVKPTAKNPTSNRQIAIPAIIQNLIDKVDTEYITNLTHWAIYKRFKRKMCKLDYNDITFHDLRHINASVMLALNVPDKYAMERGGWATTSTLKDIYQQTFSDERIKFDNRIDDYFDNLYSMENDS